MPSEGTGFVERLRDRPACRVGGNGLRLVASVTARGGVHSGPSHVWFEVAGRRH